VFPDPDSVPSSPARAIWEFVGGLDLRRFDGKGRVRLGLTKRGGNLMRDRSRRALPEDKW
jgi:hypothetical protein